MDFDFTIPQTEGGEFLLRVSPGTPLFVLGANGTGKSTLMQRLYGAGATNIRRITAHRQMWFQAGATTFSAQQNADAMRNVTLFDTQEDSRHRDAYHHERPLVSLYRLVSSDYVRSKRVTAAVDAENCALARQLSSDASSTVDIVNELLKLIHLGISISITDGQEVLATKGGGLSYNVAKLSDGERNALLIAADVLTASPDTLFLIDEPERHLHRSISSPLLTSLFARRPDCAFVVSTHDVMLPLDAPKAQVLLLRSCNKDGEQGTSWQLDRTSAHGYFDEGIMRDVLGGRRKILFVEGEKGSLDKPLYNLVFPDVSVVEKGSCRDVSHAVSGIRAASNLHWVKAFGLIDGDGRSQCEISELRDKGVYAVPCYSVESIYYHPKIQSLAAAELASVTGQSLNDRLEKAKSDALHVLDGAREDLCSRVIHASLRDMLASKLPKRQDIFTASTIGLQLDVAKVRDEELTRFSVAVDSKDLSSLIQRYPVRHSSALDRIASGLGFQDRKQYEGSVETLLANNTGALAFVQALFANLLQDMAA